LKILIITQLGNLSHLHFKILKICRGADNFLAFLFLIFLFAGQPKEFFLDELKKLEHQSHKCVELRGEYLNTFFQSHSLSLLYEAKDLSALPPPLVYRIIIMPTVLHACDTHTISYFSGRP
jgi:hypothetical protein